MAEIKADITLDARGLTCPMPVLRTKKAIDGISSGQVLKVIATDVASKADIPALINRLGHEILEIKEAEGAISFLIRKK